jgi:hypothetical protein
MEEPMVSESKKVDGFGEWEIDSAARTLQEAEELKANDALYKLAVAKLAQKKEALDKILSDKQVEARATKKLKEVFGK